MTPEDVRMAILVISSQTGWGLEELLDQTIVRLLWWGHGLADLNKQREKVANQPKGKTIPLSKL